MPNDNVNDESELPKLVIDLLFLKKNSIAIKKQHKLITL